MFIILLTLETQPHAFVVSYVMRTPIVILPTSVSAFDLELIYPNEGWPSLI